MAFRVAVLVICAGCSVLRAAPQAGYYRREGLDPGIAAVIDEFRASVPGRMDKGDVPGAAIALVDGQGILWAEGFGRTGGKGEPRVTADTPFLICGLSKLITATTVMLAVQEGLVRLDEPITTYLPDFTVNSRYEKDAGRKITLRHLLTCTAGLPTEAPLGNYFEPASTVSFKQHVESIFGSWLVHPVGNSAMYSSASFDLAAYVVQVVSGKPFEQYVRDKLFIPLGMSGSMADSDEILRCKGRAVGHMLGVSCLPAVYPGLASGSMYASVKDLARLVQLHINRGTLDGRRFLDESLVEAIHTPVGVIRTDPTVYYGMGIHVDTRAPARTEQILWHEGWGFGFTSHLHWYPEYGVGVVVLTNKLPHPVLDDLGLALTDRLIAGKLIAKSSPHSAPDTGHCLGAWCGWPAHQPTPYERSCRRYCGTHNLRFNGYRLEWWAYLAILIKGRGEFTPRIEVREKDGFLCVTESEFFDKVGFRRHIDERLQEIRPGLFAAASGMMLDFTSDIPTWRNYHLKKD